MCRFSGNICGDTPASLTMKGNDRKGNSMYRKQGDLKRRRQVSLAAQWRKRYKHNIDVWHAETAATAPRDVEREAMDDANLMVIVHNSTDRRDKAPKYVRRKHKHAYSEHLRTTLVILGSQRSFWRFSRMLSPHTGTTPKPVTTQKRLSGSLKQRKTSTGVPKT